MMYLKVSQKMQLSNLFRMNKVEGSATQKHNRATFYSSHKEQNNLALNSYNSIPPADSWPKWNSKALSLTTQEHNRAVLQSKNSREPNGGKWTEYLNYKDCVGQLYNLKLCLSLILSFLDHCILHLLLKQKGIVGNL